MDTTIFQLSAEQLRALYPVLFLSLATLISVISSGFQVKAATQRLLGIFVFAIFIYLNAKNLPFKEESILGASLFLGLLSKLSGIVVGALALCAAAFVDDEDNHPEWLPLLCVSVIGLSLLVSARDWVSFFVYLETFAMPSYVLASLRLKKDGGFESGIKYLMLGAFSSAIFLLGITFIYGFSGSFDYLSVHESLMSAAPESPYGLLFAGYGLVIVSVGFKVALAPFHMWAPDVYQSAPAPMASFLATAVKFSVFVAAFTAFSQAGMFQVAYFQMALSSFGVLSILVGNLMALKQVNLRRMLAYASVASAGNAAVAFAVGPTALSSVFVYLAVYGFNIIAFFALLEWAARRNGLGSSSQLELPMLAKALQGKPLLIGFFGVVLFSLVGLPPLPGFFGKYLILRDLLRSELYFETGAVLLGSLMALAYYLKIFVPIAMEEEKSRVGESPVAIRATIPLAGFMMASALLVLSYAAIVQYFKLVDPSSLFLR